jgi:hypothetical protein
LVPNPLDLRTSGHPLPGQRIPIKLIPLDKRSRSNSVPMDKWSTNICSPWTNGPQPIWSPYFWIPTACPLGQTEYSRDHLSRGTKLVGDHLYMETEFFGDHLSMGTELVRFRLSRGTNQLGTNCGGPNVRGPYAFGTKCVTADDERPRRRGKNPFLASSSNAAGELASCCCLGPPQPVE